MSEPKLSENLRNTRAESFPNTVVGNTTMDIWIDKAEALEARLSKMEEALKDSEGALHAARAAFTLVQGEYQLKIMDALTRNNKLQPIHFIMWADSISEKNGYSGANIEVWLREVAEALAGEPAQPVSEQDG